MGRMELAQRYFPYIQPRSAWLKLKSLLSEDPALEHLARLKRRTFLPVEVNIIRPVRLKIDGHRNISFCLSLLL